jgi:hypothetical protein
MLSPSTSVNYPRLPRTWKSRYPFRLACPSFVYPADYDVNVDILGPHVDEIELLFFESHPQSFPGDALVNRLVGLGQRHNISYNIHLPDDLPLFDANPETQQRAAATVQKMMHCLAPLTPSFFILHLEMSTDRQFCAGDRRRWGERTIKGLEQLSVAGCPMSTLCIENQSVPLDWFEPLLETFGLTLCLDIGHLKLAGERLDCTLARWHSHISALHIHGVAGGKDHRALTHLSSGDQNVLTAYLRSFRGSVSVEVFNFEGLYKSLTRIEEWLG